MLKIKEKLNKFKEDKRYRHKCRNKCIFIIFVLIILAVLSHFLMLEFNTDKTYTDVYGTLLYSTYIPASSYTDSKGNVQTTQASYNVYIDYNGQKLYFDDCYVYSHYKKGEQVPLVLKSYYRKDNGKYITSRIILKHSNWW